MRARALRLTGRRAFNHRLEVRGFSPWMEIVRDDAPLVCTGLRCEVIGARCLSAAPCHSQKSTLKLARRAETSDRQSFKRANEINEKLCK